jgi:hypothetical protein
MFALPMSPHRVLKAMLDHRGNENQAAAGR